MILADTFVWIEHLRRGEAGWARELDEFLAQRCDWEIRRVSSPESARKDRNLRLPPIEHVTRIPPMCREVEVVRGLRPHD